MALVHYTLTLDGTAQNLKTALALLDSEDVPLQLVTLQPAAANANPVYVGGAGVTALVHGYHFPAQTAAFATVDQLTESPLKIQALMRPVKLSEIFVLGTAAQKLHILGVSW